MKVFGMIDPTSAKCVAKGQMIPLLLNGGEKIGEATVETSGAVQGEVDDKILPIVDGRGYGFKANATDEKEIESIDLVTRI